MMARMEVVPRRSIRARPLSVSRSGRSERQFVCQIFLFPVDNCSSPCISTDTGYHTYSKRHLLPYPIHNDNLAKISAPCIPTIS